jgi:hypothetical protein
MQKVRWNIDILVVPLEISHLGDQAGIHGRRYRVIWGTCKLLLKGLEADKPYTDVCWVEKVEDTECGC